MCIRKVCLVVVLALLSFLACALPALAHGDKVIPQVADGVGVIRTKFDVSNLSPVERITKVTVLFFRQNGTPWSIATNQGTASEFTLILGRFQTIRLETLGTTSTLTSGYAVIRNRELTSVYSEDFEVGITVFYEILSGSSIADTVSVPVGQPTVVWVFPVEIDVPKNLLTGFAIVNLANLANKVTLRLWGATNPPSADASDDGMVELILNANQQRAQFLNESSLFPSKSRFKGLLIGVAEKPVSVLGLLQTPTPSGVQYATLVAAYADALRKNTYMYLRQGFPLDADIPLSDYWAKDDTPWDLLYETQSTTARRLSPQSGAMFSVIGSRTDTQFDGIGVEELQGLTYSTSSIDMSNGSANLVNGFAFAIKTALGRFVKVRVGDVISRDTNRDLALEIFVYR